ncbi:MAG: type IV pilus assembly protein PilN [Gammaproteobacteria bacterium]|jgi:type IV pilus assembly protein PilN
MPKINLLPWRAELRKRRNKEFGISAVVVAAAMAAVVAGVDWNFQQRIDFQNERNSFLVDQIVSLDKKIEQIKELDREKARLLARMNIIQQLQSSRPEIVRVVDSIVETLPDGVFYTSIAQAGLSFKVLGVAQSNARVSSLMRQLESSDLFENPKLVEIKATQTKVSSGEVKLSSFSLNVTQTQKKKVEEADGDKKS